MHDDGGHGPALPAQADRAPGHRTHDQHVLVRRERAPRGTDEWREEIHDSDGLSMWRGNGEWVWRPLTNPPTLQVSSFLDENPRGFGLLQRDRDFAHYQDEAFRYERRPSVWIEPLASWGKGRVLLGEIPTADETFDNIVAFWQPDAPAVPGAQLELSYRVHWVPASRRCSRRSPSASAPASAAAASPASSSRTPRTCASSWSTSPAATCR